MSVFIPGVGNYAHHHSGLYNVDWLQASLILRNPDEVAQQQRGRAHPSRGAVSPYYNATLMATRAIPPGMELYCNLGSPMDDLESDVFQEKVTRWDYEHADKLLDNILAFMERFEGQMSDSFKNTILDFMVENVLEGASPKRAKVIRSLLPQRIDKLREVKDAGGTFEYRNRDIPKSPEWFEEHGLCVDNLRPGQSTIPDAGRGAFANRAIKEGATISPVQMLPILDAEVFDLYSETIAVEEEDGSIELCARRRKRTDGTAPSFELLLWSPRVFASALTHGSHGESDQSRPRAVTSERLPAVVRTRSSLQRPQHARPTLGSLEAGELSP